jgi:cell division protein ZapB
MRLGCIPRRTAAPQGCVDFIVFKTPIHTPIPSISPNRTPCRANRMIPRMPAFWPRTTLEPGRAIDSLGSGLYIHAMADDAHVKFEHELKRLEKRVDALVQVCDQLKDENRSLKQRQDALTAERATLLQKNEQVRARVEAMIGRLKAMEQGS